MASGSDSSTRSRCASRLDSVAGAAAGHGRGDASPSVVPRTADRDRCRAADAVDRFDDLAHDRRGGLRAVPALLRPWRRRHTAARAAGKNDANTDVGALPDDLRGAGLARDRRRIRRKPWNAPVRGALRSASRAVEAGNHAGRSVTGSNATCAARLRRDRAARPSPSRVDDAHADVRRPDGAAVRERRRTRRRAATA